MGGCFVLHWKMLSVLHLLGIWSFSSFSFPGGQFYKKKKKNYIYIYMMFFFGQFYGEKKGNQNFYFLSPCYIIEVSLSLFLFLSIF